ncbi:MAG: hypothetical protein IT184_09370 [Acidobacteria bacterium]|nr:hypothetical protein [Acidobacteriota bacterium]
MPSSNPVTPILVPRVSVNDDVVVVARLIVEPGQRVARGDIVAVIETTKASFDVESPADGHCWFAVSEGDDVAVGAEIGQLTDGARPPSAGLPRASARVEGAAPVEAPTRVEAPARVDPSTRIEGVARVEAPPRDAEPAVRPPVAAAASIAATPAATGILDPAFLADIRKPGSGFADLASDLKVRLYRQFGALVDDDVVFEPGAAIYAASIQVGRGCRFGARTVIQAESLVVGVGGLFGHDNDIMCRHLRFGDMLFLVNRVLIGQGGAFNAEASLTVGHSCLVSSDCLINTSHAVTIGDVSCLSPRVSIYTHSHWQNVLDGYTASFAPVTIGRHVWVTGGCLVTPGTVMEDGSQALANSLITGRVPARTIVAGVPAKPITAVRGQLSPAAKDHLMRARVWPEVVKAMRAAGMDPASAAYTGLRPAGDCSAIVQAAFGPCPEGYGGCYFDLESYRVQGEMNRAADEVRNVLRKHGVRFESHLWRYRADVGKFNA